MKNSPKRLEKFATNAMGTILMTCGDFPKLRKMGPKASLWEVSVAILDAEAMRKLNRELRGKDSATDVLSFVAPEPFYSEGLLGEIVLCEDVVEAQAKEQGHPMEFEACVLLVHGVLHLLGMDHEESPLKAKVMMDWEQKILKAMIGEKKKPATKKKPVVKKKTAKKVAKKAAKKSPKGLIRRAK